jgi:glutathionylspermidine synthase
MLEDEEDQAVTTAALWSMSQIGGEEIRIYLQSLLDKAEDDAQIEFLEDALDNLTFTEDQERFSLIALDPDEPEK